MSNKGDPKDFESGSTASHHRTDSSMHSTSDFVKKLYKILEDPELQPIISWGPKGDCFVVKDVNEFQKTVLPRVFNHSNFSSFVRQLNKYDFHKVKNPDENTYGSQAWTFYHPDFLANRRDALENIKRKVPVQSTTQTLDTAAAMAIVQQQQQQAALLGASPANLGFGGMNLSLGGLTNEIRGLRDDNEDLKKRLRMLERNYRDVLVKMVGFQQSMVQQNELLQSIVAYVLGNDRGRQDDGTIPPKISYPSSQQRSQSPPPYSRRTQRSQYGSAGGSGGYNTPAGGQLTPPPSLMYTPEMAASLPTFDLPMQDAIPGDTRSPSTTADLSATSNPSLSNAMSAWDPSSSDIYSVSPGHGSGVPRPGPSGHQELGGLGNVGMSLSERNPAGSEPGMGAGGVGPYAMW